MKNTENCYLALIIKGIFKTFYKISICYFTHYAIKLNDIFTELLELLICMVLAYCIIFWIR